jgi:hypothetical protein
LNGISYRVRAAGTKHFRWIVECGDYLILIANPDTDWPVSIRYLSAGLWEHGPQQLRERALRSLAPYTVPGSDDFQRITRADYCYDFHSPAFTKEFLPGQLQDRVVCHSSTKIREQGESYTSWGNSARGQTLEIGRKTGLQLSIYDKSLEITEMSGKTWFYELWGEQSNGKIFNADVWRIEARFSGDFLKERNIRRTHELIARRAELIAEAIFTRRLTRGDDPRKRRRPLHPLWSEVARMANATAMLPIGRRVTGRRDVLLGRSIIQLAGTMRALSILAFGCYDEEKLRGLINDVWQKITSDPAHVEKITQLLLRYSDVDEAQ